MSLPWILDTDEKVANFNRAIDAKRMKGEDVRVKFVDGKRSKTRNDQVRAVYNQVNRQIDDDTLIGIERQCKLLYGVPLLRANDEVFRELYDKTIKNNLCHEDKLLAMDMLTVTSRMSEKLCREYIAIVIEEYSKQGLYMAQEREYGSWIIGKNVFLKP